MPINSFEVTLSDTTPALIVGSDNMPQEIVLHNMSKSSNNYVFIAGSSEEADITNNIHIDPGDNLYLTMRPNDELWGLSDPSGLNVGVLRIRLAD
jgi:hypothetical protein